MSEYQDRIKKLRKRWDSTKKADTGGISRVPEGKYQGELVAAKMDKKTYRVSWAFKIVRGEYAGKKLYCRHDLLWEPKEIGDPDGLSYFKAALDSLGLDYSSPEPKQITKTLKGAIGSIADLYVQQKGQFQNVFINGLVDAGDDDVEEEDEDEEEGEDDDTGAESEDDDEESEEGEDEDEDSTEEDEDEDEEEELEPILPEGQLVTFTHDGDSYEGRYVKPADEKTSIITVENDGEEEEWEVADKDLKRKPGRPKGAKNKKTDRSAKKKKKGKKSKKKSKDAEPETDDDLEDEEWGDEWED